MGTNDGMPIYHYLAEVQICCTDRLHRPDEHENVTPKGRNYNEKVIRWNIIVRNLASRNAGWMILMDLEHELRAMDQARFTTDGVHFDSIEGQAWMNRVFQERLEELEVELFDTGVQIREETANEPVPAVPQSSSELGQRTDVLD